MNLSKNHLKLITGLHRKKYRQSHKLFVVEGVKVVKEFLASSFELFQLFSTEENFEGIQEAILIKDHELKKISSLVSPNKVVAVFKIPEENLLPSQGLILALDSINDPGNLGTIIRLCDWFGVRHIVCSQDTVDCFNPKVVQASMGSLTRVSLHYTEVHSFLKDISLPVFTADMGGANVYHTNLPEEAVLVMGNEANGISETTKKLSDHIVSIPGYGNLQQTESLNVATATAILLSEFRRSL